MKNIFKKVLALLAIAGVGTAVSVGVVNASAKENNTVETTNNTYHNYEIISGTTERGKSFKYSDGFFAVDPVYYNAHMATASMSLTYESDNKVVRAKDENGNEYDDYSHGGDNLAALYEKMGFKNVYISDSYKVKPTTDSIGYVMAMKEVDGKKVVGITVRSSSYDSEWASNVTLGKEGEAAGFASAATQVMQGVEKYVTDNNLTADLENGNVKFWVSGFSRGGATANLTAKRLIDNYQEKGNQVYAYCIEAPRGGLWSQYVKGRNYNSIHNVININDLVTEVAPKAMNFVRYGIDHYLIGDAANYNRALTGFTMGGTGMVADNVYYLDNSEEYKAQAVKAIAQTEALGSDKKPYVAKLYNYDLGSFEVKEVENANVTTNSVIDSLMKTVTATTNRSQYVDRGYQTAAFNLLRYLYNSGVSVGAMKDALLKNQNIWTLLPVTSILKSLNDVRISNGFFETIKTLFTDRSKLRLSFDFTEKHLKALANDFVNNLFEYHFEMNEAKNIFFELTHEFTNSVTDNATHLASPTLNEVFANYNGGVAQAKKDFKALVELALRNVPNPTFLATVAKNIGGILDNHDMLLTAGWLRSYDSWFETTANYPEV